MNKIVCAMVAVGCAGLTTIAGCAAESGTVAGEGTNAESIQQATNVSGTTSAYGLAFNAWVPFSPNPDITYVFSTSTAAETALRAPSQSIAPMIRDLNSATANERSNLVGYGLLGIWVSSGSAATNVTTAQIKQYFVGDDDSTSTAFPNNCSATLNGVGGISPVRFIPDSGEDLEFFKTKVGITKNNGFKTFCPGTVEVSKPSGTLTGKVSALSSGTPVQNTYTLTAAGGASTPCVAADAALECIGKQASDTNAVKVGITTNLGAKDIANNTLATKALNVNSVQKTDANVRNLSYLFSRELWLNENTVNTSNTDETNLYNYLYNGGGVPADGKTRFDASLTTWGLLPCSTGGALQCGVGVCSSLNDGRGIGNGTSAARCVR